MSKAFCYVPTVRMFIAPLLLILSCSNLSQVRDKEWIKDPNKCFDFFRESINAGEYGDAYECLSKKSKELLKYEVFYSGLTQFSYMRRLIKTTRVHNVKVEEESGTIFLCNEEFGFSMWLPIRKEFKKIWTLELGQEELDLFMSRTLAWFNFQKEKDGQLFVYPSNWEYHKIWKRCPCQK